MKLHPILHAVILLCLVASGCSSNIAAAPSDVDARVKNLQPPSGKALVYILRPTWLGKPFAGHITANGQVIGSMEGEMYVYAALDPGQYEFKVTGQDNDSHITVNLEAGKKYYIYQSVYSGVLKGFTSLDLVDDDKGRAALGQCALSNDLGSNVVP